MFVDLSQSAKIFTSKPKSVSCLLNSTERCQYRWIKIQDGIQTTVLNGHTLNLEDMGDFLCEASCTIRGQLCTMHPMSVVFHKDHYGEQLISAAYILILVHILLLDGIDSQLYVNKLQYKAAYAGTSKVERQLI